MTTLGRALYAELLKTKRTLALLVACLAPLSIILLNVLRYLQRNTVSLPGTREPWAQWMGDQLMFWALMMLPLCVTLETGLLSATEHGNKMWKQLFALPIPRWTVYAAKQIIAWGLIGTSTAILLVATIPAGLILHALRPEIPLVLPVPWETILTCAALSFLGGWLITALHFWIGAHWPSFVLAMSVGIVMTVAGIMVVQSDWVKVYPWTLPGFIGVSYLNGQIELPSVLLGFLGGIAMSVFGAWEVTRRDVI